MSARPWPQDHCHVHERVGGRAGGRLVAGQANQKEWGQGREAPAPAGGHVGGAHHLGWPWPNVPKTLRPARPRTADAARARRSTQGWAGQLPCLGASAVLLPRAPWCWCCSARAPARPRPTPRARRAPTGLHATRWLSLHGAGTRAAAMVRRGGLTWTDGRGADGGGARVDLACVLCNTSCIVSYGNVILGVERNGCARPTKEWMRPANVPASLGLGG